MITSYTIEIHEPDTIYADFKYVAVMDNYDGAPDGNNAIGRGDWHGEAIQDLIDSYIFEDEK